MKELFEFKRRVKVGKLFKRKKNYFEMVLYFFEFFLVILIFFVDVELIC